MNPRSIEARFRQAKDQGVIERGEVTQPDPEDLLPIPRCMRMTMLEVVCEILKDNPELKVKAHEFYERYAEPIRALQGSLAMSRLHGLRNFGIKTDPRTDQHIPHPKHGVAVHVTATPYLHSRFQHTQFVAAHFTAIGLHLRVPFERLITGVLGSIAHDIGHSAFCHDGDELLVEKGRPPHEERGKRIVMTDVEVTGAIRAAGASPEEVAAIISEAGELGALQKIADTLGYVVMDAEIVGRGLDLGFSTKLVRSLVGVAQKRVAVSDVRPLEKLLVSRAELSRDVYYHPRNLVAAAAFRFAMKQFVELGLPLDAIEHGTDGEIEMRMSMALNGGGTKPPPCAISAWTLGHGFIHELDSWEVHEFMTRERLEEYFWRIGTGRVAKSFMIEPFDYAKKKYLVTTPDGEEHTLQAPGSLLAEESRLYHSYVWREP